MNREDRRMRKLPVGIQTFSEIIEENQVYVDKTDLIWHLAHGVKYNFLSRPRRFGKSLMLSTLAAYYEGRAELFAGLKLEQLQRESGEERKSYPVIMLSMAGGDGRRIASFERLVEVQMNQLDARYGVDTAGFDIGSRLACLLSALSRKYGSRVVVLIDEYDSPLLDTLSVENPQLHEQAQGLLRSVYANLKNYDEIIQFAMLTGVSQFSQLSLFSGLNNIRNISLDEDWATLCGITQEELEENFGEYIELMASEFDCSRGEMLEMLRAHYDGYKFTPRGEHVYCPYGLLNAFVGRDLDNYWARTGTPKVLDYILSRYGVDAASLEDGVVVGRNQISTMVVTEQTPIPMLYQTGYLTIKEVVGRSRFKLAFPNAEVRDSLAQLMLGRMLGPRVFEFSPKLDQLLHALHTRDVDGFMGHLAPILASLSGGNERKESSLRESHFRNAMYVVFTLVGEQIRYEVPSARGRSDCELQLPESIYIFELKLKSSGQSARDALWQIRERGYGDKYLGEGKPIVCVGAEFDSTAGIEWEQMRYEALKELPLPVNQ